MIREGAQVAIVGAPNVGKSSLFNALLNANRAIVTAVPGTTRDLLTERADIGGLSLALIDTAGVRDTADIVEQEGVSRGARGACGGGSDPGRARSVAPADDDDRALLEHTAARPRVIVVNKCDLPARVGRERVSTPPRKVRVAGTPSSSDQRLDRLRTRRCDRGNRASVGRGRDQRDRPAVTNLRHAMLLERARAALLQATSALEGSISEEFPLLDLQEAGHALQEITGRRTTDDLLQHIFKNFCIGK